MSAPLVSIIVPVYNSEKYLEDCLDSLLAQQLPSFEIICVDDGAMDDSPRILTEYSEKYREIHVIHQKNAGVSAARNHGLSVARGTYICFCDSDDCLLAGILEQAAGALKAGGGGELAFFEMKRVPDGYCYQQDTAPACPVTWGFEERILKNLYVFLFLISRELIVRNGISFLEGLPYSEDELFVMDLLRSVSPEKVCYLHGTGYLHRNNPGSVMNVPKWHRAPRHYEAMKIFAKELQSRVSSEDAVRKELCRRQYQAVSNALYDGFFMEKLPGNIVRELALDGLYPYPLQWKTLKIADFKTTVSNYVRFLFPFRGYYLLICKLVRMGLKLYKKE